MCLEKKVFGTKASDYEKHINKEFGEEKNKRGIMNG